MNTTDNNTQERFQRGDNNPDANLVLDIIPGRYIDEIEVSQVLADNAFAYMKRALVAMGNTSLGGVDNTMFQRNVSSIQESSPVVNVANPSDLENVTQTGAYEPLRSEPQPNQDAYTAAVLAINDPSKQETPATDEAAARDVVGAIFAEAEAEAEYIANGIQEIEAFANKTLENA